MIDLDAVSERHDKAILVGRKPTPDSLPDGMDLDLRTLFACCSDIPELLGEVGRLHAAIKEIEAPGSLLCNCDEQDGYPSNGDVRLDHFCECPAVMASAAILGGHKYTKHASECTCADIYDQR